MDNRTRKVPSQFIRQEWRNKTAGNQAHLKYSREQILKNYKNLKQPPIQLSDEIQSYFLSHPSPPILTAIFPFSHSLGEEVNSRKHLAREKRIEQMPEWYEEEEPKEITIKPQIVQEINEKTCVKEEPVADFKVVLTATGVKNLEDKDIEDNFSKIDLKVEEKLKNAVAEDEYSAPDWDDPVEEEFEFEPIKPVKPPAPAPVFDINLLRYHYAIGNPFIRIMLDFGIPVGKSNMTFTPGSKPFEKIWYYKDLEKNIQGPFSTLEMFAWTIRDCFPIDLEISVGTTSYFVPMNLFNEISESEKLQLDTEPPSEIADSGFSLYDSKTEAPQVITLSEKESKENIEVEKYEKVEKNEKVERNEKDEKAEKTKNFKTLEEIESFQHSYMGKESGNAEQVAPKVILSNEAATMELKNFLGLLNKS